MKYVFQVLWLIAPLVSEEIQLFIEANPSVPERYRSIESLSISASRQFSESGFKWILEQSEKKIVVVDLRRECHGFIKGEPVSWKLTHVEEGQSAYAYNEGLTVEEIEERELQLLSQFAGGQSERQLVEGLGAGYVRIPVTERIYPDAAQIEQLIDELSQDVCLHFHCAGGRGRTTTFLCMVDMLENNRTSSFEQILRNQQNLGGSDLLSSHHDYRFKRLEFLRRFYQCCLENSSLSR